MNKKRIVILGGGISALSCANRLLELKEKAASDYEVMLLEATSRVGGNIRTENRNGFILEEGPDSFLSEKPVILNLIQRLGIEARLRSTQTLNRKVLIAHKGRLTPLPEGFYLMAPTKIKSLLSTSLLTPLAKARMAMEIFIPPQKNADYDESVANFIKRRFGREALDVLGQPMIAGIHAGDPERLSLQAVLPKFKQLEQKYGSVILGLIRSSGKRQYSSASGPRYSMFLSFDEGMEVLPKTLSERLGKNIHLNSSVKHIEFLPGESKWRLSMGNGESLTADVVCSALPAKQTAKLFADAVPQLSRQLQKISYHSVVTLNFAYKTEDIGHALDSFGFVVPDGEGKSLLACTFTTQKFSGRAPEGYVLLRAFVGGYFGEKFYQMDDADLKKIVHKHLKEYLHIRKEPLFCLLTRFHEGLPQYHIGHREIINLIDKELSVYPSLFLTGSAYRGSGIPDAVQDSENQAAKIADLLNQKIQVALKMTTI